MSSEGSGYIIRNPDFFARNYSSSKSTVGEPYLTFSVAPADKSLSSLVDSHLRKVIAPKKVINGLNVTAESFYSSQGRIDDSFDDNNLQVIDTILSKYPSALTLEMESFMLLHLAKCCRIPIYATAAGKAVCYELFTPINNYFCTLQQLLWPTEKQPR